MAKYFTFFLILIFSFDYAQTLNCNEFKEGTFILISDNFPNAKWEINRFKDYQIEKVVELTKEMIDVGYPKNSYYENIKWIDSCKFLLTYNVEKNQLDEFQIAINEAGGLITEVIDVKDNCFYIKSEIELNGERIVMTGKMYKQK